MFEIYNFKPHIKTKEVKKQQNNLVAEISISSATILIFFKPCWLCVWMFVYVYVCVCVYVCFCVCVCMLSSIWNIVIIPKNSASNLETPPIHLAHSCQNDP